MALPQKPIRLDTPIDVNAPPTIYSCKLTPELSNAALNLTIDFQRQKQSSANKHILTSPVTLSIVLSIVSTFGYFLLSPTVNKGGLYALKYEIDKIFQILIFGAMITSIVFTIASKPTEIIRINADSIAEDSSSIFGYDLKKFSTINSDAKDKESKALLAKGENSTLVIYRDTPIAIITLDVCTPERSTFITKITGVGIRKVYYKSGIIDDLFDFAIKRTLELNNLQKNPNDKLLILIQVLSTDKELKESLSKRDFIYISQTPINHSNILRVYKVHNEIWGLALNVKKAFNTDKKIQAVGSNSKDSVTATGFAAHKE